MAIDPLTLNEFKQKEKESKKDKKRILKKEELKNQLK